MDGLGFAAGATFSGARLRTAARCATSRGGPRMSVSRREALAGAAGAAAAALLAGANAALAKSGDAPKISVFGVGGASSPFTAGVQKGGKVMYTAFNEDEVNIFKKCIESSKDRLANAITPIQGKSWEDVQSQLRLEMNELRSTAVKLNSNIPDKATAAKANKAYADFKLAIENLDYAATIKNKDKALKSHSAAVKSLNAWSDIIGI